MAPFEKCFIGFDGSIDENYRSFHVYTQPTIQYSLKYDSERNQFCFCIWNRVWQEPVPESERRKNWPRAKYRNMYMKKCLDKIQEIVNDGFAFSDVRKMDGCNECIFFVKNNICG